MRVYTSFEKLAYAKEFTERFDSGMWNQRDFETPSFKKSFVLRASSDKALMFKELMPMWEFQIILKEYESMNQ